MRHSAGGMSTGECSCPRAHVLGVKDIRAGENPPFIDRDPVLAIYSRLHS